MSCHCGRAASYADCCQKIHSQKLNAATAEDLMRARYSAFVVGDIDFIMKTHLGEDKDDADREALETWSKESEWLGLEVVATEKGSEKDKTGVVEFKAKFKAGGETHSHHERATFQKIDGHWFFEDGKMVQAPLKREAPKVGRNDPCSCGSGKKYKKCCGA